MKITYNWLKDFVEIKISPKELAEKLTMAGLEVTSLEQKDGDFVFEIEVTSNRPDCLSVIGVAREVAVITNKKLRVTSYELRVTKRNTLPFKIEIENKKDCPLYTAKIIREVKVDPSPDRLKERLELIGCHSVNNIVDTTNYILFTWGEPLHAFDLDKLVSPLASYPASPLQIIIRRAKKDEEIITIDGARRILSEEILVIASGNDRQTGKQANRQTGKPIAIAGIMGGKDAEVTESTKNILLEAAVFNPIIIRRARQKLGIQSDSSYRFERGVDSQIVEEASGETVKLIQELTSGKCVLAKSSGSAGVKTKSIDLEVSRVNKILGADIAPGKIKKILNSLEFKSKAKAKNCFRVKIPSHRPDVNLEIDLIEEISRIWGYDNIPKTLPEIKPQVAREDLRGPVSLIKNILVGLGLNEVITYSLIDKDLLRSFKDIATDETIEILNPLSREQEILRPSLIPSLAACIAYNLNQKQDYVNIFEVAKVFLPIDPTPKEELRLGIALCGMKPLLLEQGLIKDTVGFLHLKGILETLFGRIGVKGYGFETTNDASLVAINIGKEKIGFLTQFAKNILASLDIKNKEVFVAELRLEGIFSYINMQKKFSHLPVYPGIFRDISLVLKESIAAEGILGAIKEKGRPLLKEAKVIDYYKGKQIPPGFKGLTISCLYRSDERTLTETEINPAHSLICHLLAERFGAQIR